MDFEIVLESFERWFKGYQLTDCDITNIVMGIILVVLLIVLIVMLVIISIQTLFWTRIGWFFEDFWHWLKRNTPLGHCQCFGEEDLTNDEIHEVMNLIYDSNLPKYEIKDDFSVNE